MRWGAAGLRAGRRVRMFRPLQLALLVVPLLLSGLPVGILGPTTSGPPSPSSQLAVAGPPPVTLPNETLTIRNQTIGNLSNFWGAGVNPGYNLTNVTNETQGTPIDWVVWPAGDVADQYDMVNGTLWTNGVPATILNDEAQFVTACLAISCHAIFTVPGEINDSAFGAYEVWYTEQVLNFHPAYWEIGNEPYKWEHFGKA